MSLNKFWYLYKLIMMQNPFLNFLEEGKKEGNTSSFLLFKKRKEGKFWKILEFYAFGIDRDSSLVLKWSCLRLILL